MPAQSHVPVMPDRVVALLAPALAEPGAVLLDATVGLGGHAEAILGSCPGARVVGVDRDPTALEIVRTSLTKYAARITLVHAVYDTLDEVTELLGIDAVRGVLFDLGVSSVQLDVRERGFSYSQDAPLDMRMDPTRGPSAADLLNTYSAADLARILRSYGEERFARRIADAIVSEREREPFASSARLVSLIRDVIPAAARRTGGNPAKRTFQALRIEVNDELSVLRRALPTAIDVLAVGGRIVVLSYHSLEDRLAKNAMTSRSRTNVPEGVPVVAAALQPELRVLTRGAERASAAEIQSNPRAASARLRAAERIREVA